jgi:ATP adenylyltransferase
LSTDDTVPKERRVQAGGGNAGQEWLWAPWRMEYVKRDPREHDCIFCAKANSRADIDDLVLWRGASTFAIMNLYPYNTGHFMVAPFQHLASPEMATDQVAREIAQFTPALLRATRRAFRCQGFNLGLNIGSVAGAGVADHMHWHVVPRWQGDANFMPILASTTVMPETLPVTYAKLRAEIVAEIDERAVIHQLVLNDQKSGLLVIESDGRTAIPELIGSSDTPVWERAIAILESYSVSARLVTWSGSDTANEAQKSALGWIASSAATPIAGAQWLPIESLSEIDFAEGQRATVDDGIRRIEELAS